MKAFGLILTSVLALLQCLPTAKAALSASQIIEDLGKQLSPASEIVNTSSQVYTHNFTPRFGISAPPTYIVGVKPALATDVQKVVLYASQNNVPFLATGGGHGYSWSLERLSVGIDLDLGNFKDIEIDTSANTMIVGGAALLGNVTQVLQEVGKELPVGQCATVGIGGITLGGGVGPFGGIYGAMSDSLLSVEMVTGNGKILNVSETHHSDLFYGMKGAGFNYGIALNLQFKIYPAVNNGLVTVANMLFPGKLNGSIWELAASFIGAQPKEFTLDFSIGWNATMGGIALTTSFYFAGPRDQAMKLFQPFLDLNPLEAEVLTASYHNLSSVAWFGAMSGGIPKNIQFTPYAVNLYEVDVPNLVRVFGYMNAYMAAKPELQDAAVSWTQISTYGFQSHANTSSAFPYRDVGVFFQFDGYASNSSSVAAVDRFGQKIRHMLQTKSGRKKLEVYVNFAHGDEGPEVWYSAEALPRLRALKARYDPHNLFRFYNPVDGQQ